MRARALVLMSGLALGISAMPAMAQDNRNATLNLVGEVPLECNVLFTGENSGSTATANIDVTSGGSYSANVIVDCNCSYSGSITSNNGALLNNTALDNQLAGSSAGQSAYEIPYSLTVSGFTSDGTALNATSAELDDGVAFSSNAMFDANGSIQVSWDTYSDLFAGQYTDSLTASITPDSFCTN